MYALMPTDSHQPQYHTERSSLQHETIINFGKSWGQTSTRMTSQFLFPSESLDKSSKSLCHSCLILASTPLTFIFPQNFPLLHPSISFSPPPPKPPALSQYNPIYLLLLQYKTHLMGKHTPGIWREKTWKAWKKVCESGLKTSKKRAENK